jgi:predicted peptidase
VLSVWRYSLVALLPLLALGPVRAQKPDTEWQDLLEKRTFEGDKGSLPYRLLKPEGYNSKTKYPLLIFLHGAGERGKDNKAQLVHGVVNFASPANRKKYPCFLIAPQCPTGQFWSGRNTQMVLDLIAALRKEFSIDEKRIYLTGLSMGGYGTWSLLAQKPELFAAGIPICGGGAETDAPTLAKIPIWAFHGDKDTAVKVERSRTMIEAIKKAGGKPKYTEYPGVGHDSWTVTYKNPEVMKWLFAQKKE